MMREGRRRSERRSSLLSERRGESATGEDYRCRSSSNDGVGGVWIELKPPKYGTSSVSSEEVELIS